MQSLTSEQKQIGQDNYYEAVGVTRRDFIKGVVTTGAVTGAGLGAMYFGYGKTSNPVRIGIIGVGDEGNVLIGGCTPEYVQVKAIADIRPSSIHRAFHGDWASDAALAARPGLIKQYGYASEAQARKEITGYDQSNGGIEALLNDKDIQAVIIALPLFLHAPIAIQAMLRGKHVLTEKLMAHNVGQCKAMARHAKETELHCATGHQRHYSVLYDNAVHLIRYGLLGQLHHIRAQWHRGNLPGKDSWQMPLPGGEVVTVNGKGTKVNKISDQLNGFKKDIDSAKDAIEIEQLQKKIAQWEAWEADAKIDAKNHGYEDKQLKTRVRTAMEELCRWRLWERTGGLMAELGSHQLDASTIFCSALRKDGSKAHPLSVHAVGGRHIFPMDREAEDHVYCMFEFPGPEYDPDFVGYYSREENYPPKGKGVEAYEQDPNKKVVVTYSSINGNGFGGYGEVVLGTKGTIVLDKEQELLLYKDSDTTTKAGVKSDKGRYSLDTQASGNYAAANNAKTAASGPVSRGYTEEIEHWAWCISNPDPENKPRCYPEVAMADAIIALTTNVAMANGAKGQPGYIKFEESWFDRDSNDTPDQSDPVAELERMKSWKIV